MKNLLKYLSLAVLTTMIWGGFSYSAQAATVYQQLTDFSGLSGGVASPFVSNSSNLFQNGIATAQFFNNTASTSLTIQPNTQVGTLRIGTSTPFTFSYAGCDFNTPNNGIPTVLGTGDTIVLVCTMSGLNFQTNWVQGWTYQAHLSSSNLGGGLAIPFFTDSTGVFFTGYITDEGGTSIPVLPGVPGFTDQGIATSSQQVYCADNFATSTGFLDSLGHSISIGFCNVGVFLFVPSSGAVSQYQSLNTTVQTKIPFSYYYDVKSIYENSVASSTQNMQAFSINLGLIDFASGTAMGPILPTNLDFFSSTTISKYMSPQVHDLIYNIMIAAIWVEVMFLIYNRIVPKKVKI